MTKARNPEGFRAFVVRDRADRGGSQAPSRGWGTPASRERTSASL